jgi:adenosylcobyric acid synthase
LEQRTGKPVLAVLPYLHDLYLEAEDALQQRQPADSDHAFEVVVPHLPSFSNHTDFDPLQWHPGVRVTFAKHPDQVNGADLLVLPGSKSVARDLQRLRAQGWDAFIRRHLRFGGKVLGICGGFQMLGSVIEDPHRIESQGGGVDGLGLLDMRTTLQAKKHLRHVTGRLCLDDAVVSGYEIHMGVSAGAALQRPLLTMAGRSDGALSPCGQIAGSYVHGLFDEPSACNALLKWAGFHAEKKAVDYAELREAGIELLARTWAESVDKEKFSAALKGFN